MLKLPERAIASYERAANLPGAGPPTWMELAGLYERAHRLDEAEELIERTIRSGYQFPIVSIVRGRIQRRQKRLEEAEATFLGVVQRAPVDSEWARQAWSELALMRDARGDYDGAVEAIGQLQAIAIAARRAPREGVGRRASADPLHDRQHHPRTFSTLAG